MVDKKTAEAVEHLEEWKAKMNTPEGKAKAKKMNDDLREAGDSFKKAVEVLKGKPTE